MQYEIKHAGSNAMLVINLSRGEHIRAEAGAMVAKSKTVVIDSVIQGGIGKAMKRSLFGGEGFFFQKMTAENGDGEVMVAPSALGDVKILDLTAGHDYFIQGGAFLCSMGEVELDTRMQKLSRGLFSGVGLFVLHAHGRGLVAVSSFGAIHEIEIPPGGDYIVDTGHMVAWTGDTSYKIEKAARGWISSFTSGEMLACRFTGPGKVWIQTRNPQAFGGWVRQHVPARGGMLSSLFD